MKGGAAMAAMKRVFIWLDDEREINKMWTDIADESVEFILVRDADSCISALQDNIGNKIFISLDHDLGIGDTGYGVAKFIVAHSIEIAGFNVHSMNPVGNRNILELMLRYGYRQLKFYKEINTL